METENAYTEEERKVITRAYRQLLKSIKVPIDKKDKVDLKAAYILAVESHAHQRRKSGEPYILHPIEVARISANEIGLGATAIVCALLHDVVEDTPVTIQQITKQFGPSVGLIVSGLTKLTKMETEDAMSPQAENLRHTLGTLAQDVRVILIKMADRLHNMRTLGAMPHHKQLRIAAETSFIYAPLAHRLGLYNIKTEFEDIALKITEPDSYKEIAQKLNETRRNRNAYIESFKKPIIQELDEIGVPYRIIGRPKSIYSIYNKIKKKGIRFEEIYDLFAIRIILDVNRRREKPICWEAYSIVTDVYTPIPERLKDWITTSKSNGYESLHTTVVGPMGRYVEVQIRSERMNDIAERGFAAHWKYKDGEQNARKKNKKNVYEEWLSSVREVLESNDSNAIQFLNDFKSNLFKEEVYVFTPKGEMIVLPKGASALDFAFHIHTEVGYHCQSVKVNNRIVPLGHVLENGDQIHITTSKNQKPNEAWLKMVVTGKARSKIRYQMKEEKRKAGEIGKETLMRKLKNMKADFERNIDFLAHFFDFESRVDFYFAVAQEHFNIAKLKQFEVEGGKMVLKMEFQPERIVHDDTNKKLKAEKDAEASRASATLLIDDKPANDFKYSFAPCCNPVQGDTVFAYVTVATGVKIHRTNCKNAENLMTQYGYRVMTASWQGLTLQNFVADLILEGVDGKGVVQQLTNVITNELSLDMRSITMTGGEGYFEGRISIVVKNIDQLNLSIQRLLAMDGISNVIRNS